MGGGAGIFWKLKLDSFPLTVNGGKWVPAREVTIAEWGAEGYMDGMHNVRPDLLKIISVEIEDLEHTNLEKVDLTGDWAAINNGETLEALTGGGYMRGPWEESFPLTLTGAMCIPYYGDLRVSVTVKPRVKREFETWYNRVFNAHRYMPNETTIARKYGNIESWRAQYDEMVEDKYGGA